MSKKTISIIVPCYNEEKVINIFYDTIIKVTKSLSNYDFELLFVDDGSNDNTLSLIRELSLNDDRIRYINFSRNFGKESAMLAGLQNSIGDFVCIMDADLQHPPELLFEMVEGLENGYDSVATKRKNRSGEPVLRSYFAKLFYKIVNKTSKTQITEAATDYRLMSRKMVDAVLSISEYNRFTKGIFEWVGFKTKWIEIDNVERAAGETSWSFYNLFTYAIEGIVSFSVAPLKLSSIMGILISLIAIIYSVFIFIKTIFLGIDVPGYTSLICVVLFIGGIQLISLGIIGEYLSRTYLEVKSRPNYIINENNLDDRSKNER